MSMKQDREMEEDAEALGDVRALVLDFTDYLEHDNAEVERLRALGDRLEERFKERYL